MLPQNSYDTDGQPGEPSIENLSEVISHLQDLMEVERTMLSRSLHDDLGGLLVSAVMDLGWIDQLKAIDDVRARLGRVRSALASAIDLKRNLIEDLRPSLLDNFGLFTAYRWHVQHRCKRAGVECTEQYPRQELTLRPEALSGLFRTMQEILAVILAERSVRRIDVAVTVEPDRLMLRTDHVHDGAEVNDVFRQLPAHMGAIMHRVRTFGGGFSIERNPAGTALNTYFPMDRIVVQA